MAASSQPMHGKICLVTGATSGVGLVTAHALAQQGATVVVAGRHAQRGAAAVAHIQQETGNAAVELLLADLSSQAHVRRLASAFRDRFPRLDVLVNNAGGIFLQRGESVDGIEMTFALNHLGYFLLTHLLLDTLKASAPARIVNVSSDAHRRGRMNFADLQGQSAYGGWRAYCQSKLANMLFTYALSRQLEGSGVTANALHPGFVATGFGHNNRGLMAMALRLLQWGAISPERGAQTMIHLATSSAVEGLSGAYFEKERALPSSSASYEQGVAERLWQISQDMVGR